ncbi:dermonecrotic toxin domain-containing protein [Pseudomonas lurida]|uniref:dermonecrotic toxin domain-containing protein n=1 Tax=Pseudomonas lurida TaxID=244566 RepID=UPI0034D968A4
MTITAPRSSVLAPHSPALAIQQHSTAPSVINVPPSSRAEGDRQLAQNLVGALQKTKDDGQAPVQVPPSSTLGQWRTQLVIALRNPEFQNWIKAKGIRPESIVIFPDSGAIMVTINHQRSTFTLNDNSGWSTVAGPIVSASKVIGSGSGDSIHYPEVFRDTAELKNVASFYGVPALEDATVKEIERTRAFPPIEPTDAQRSPSVRGDNALGEQQQVLAAIYQRNSASLAPPGDAQLVQRFTGEWQKKMEGGTAGLVTVPAQTTLGQWLALYGALLETPVVKNWMRDQNIDPGTLKIVPSTGAMSATVAGNTKNFSLTDNSGWRQIAGPLLEAGKVIAPSAKQSLSVSFDQGVAAVSLKVVAKFYGESTPANVAACMPRIEQLNRQKSFDAVPDERQSAYALEALRRNAAKAYAVAPAKLAYTRLATGVAKAVPEPRAQAKQLAEKILRENLSTEQLAKLEPLDADKLYLNRFQGGVAPSTARSGWDHPGEEPKRSLTLTEAVLSNFTEHDWLPGELDNNAGIYVDGPGQSKKQGYGAHNEVAIDPSTFMRAVWKADFQGEMTQKIDAFWAEHGTDYRTASKGEFVNQARQQLKAQDAKSASERASQAGEHQFTRSDYQLVMKAVSNVPADPKAPATLEQLQAEAPTEGKVRAHVFDINGWPSNIIRFADADDGQYNYENNRRDGRQILYLPGATPAFLRFDSLKKMDDWVVEQAKDPKKREALASHFSLYNRQDGGSFGKYGVDSALAHLATGDWENWEGKTIDRRDIKIAGDVFTHLRDNARERMTSDADTVIKSNSEVTRDTWLNDISAGAGLLAKLAPLGLPVALAGIGTGLTQMALGTEKSYSGDAQAERKEGAWKIFDGALNTLFSALPGAEKANDPFDLSEEELSSSPVSNTDDTPRSTPDGSDDIPLRKGARSATPPRQSSSSLIKMSAHAVSDGEASIKNVTPDALGVYRVQDADGLYRAFVRFTDETGSSKVFELKGHYKTGDMFASIINPKTGKAVMRVNPGRNREWARAPADGGVKWPWERTPSPTLSDDMKSTSTFSNQFRDLDGKKLSAGKRADEFLKFSEGSHYEFASNNYEDNGVIKANARVSWNLDETGFAVEAGEKAQITEHSSSEYSPNFVLDINRNPYTVTTTENRLLNTQRLNAEADSAEGIRQARLKQFEQAVPDADLRARISEVAHQGSIAPATIDLNGGSVLQDGYYFGADDTQFHIEHVPAKDVTTVRITSRGHLSNPEQDINHVPGVEVTITRTFTIRASNELDAPYVIDKNAPTNIEVSVAPGP